ncbi:hypothetical protein LTR28_009116 [Elasticomyces elasticus]|nr:hypothetical protein LTR28_009116 [Elasticomyces elasticus]
MALAPYRRKSVVERDFSRELQPSAPRRPARPGMLRRQSSLDTFDRRPPPRYEREDYRLPANVPVPLPRRRSPPRPRRYREEDFEEIRYRDVELEPRDEDYRDVEIRRERSVRQRSIPKSTKSDARSVTTTTRSSSDSFEEISRSPSPERKKVKKGKTRMPKRLVKKEAIIELGYPFEEEVCLRDGMAGIKPRLTVWQDDFYIVSRALEKEQIDEVIKVTERYKGPNKMTYRFEETINKEYEVPEAPPAEFIQQYRTEFINPPTAAYIPSPHSVRAPSVRSPSPASTIRARSPARSTRSRAKSVHEPSMRREIIEERIEEVGGPLVMVDRTRRSRRDIEAEIGALEAEKRALRLEREAEEKMQMAERVREEEYQVVEYREPRRELVEYRERKREKGSPEREKSPKRETVRIEKDRKGRMALVRTAQ